MPTNAFRDRMESYLKAVEQTAKDTYASSVARKNDNKVPKKNTSFENHKLEPPKESNIVRKMSYVTPESVPSLKQSHDKNKEMLSVGNHQEETINEKYTQAEMSNKDQIETVQDKSTENKNPPGPPVQLVPPRLEASKNSVESLVPVLTLNHSDKTQQPDKVTKALESKTHPSESNSVSPFKTVTSKSSHEDDFDKFEMQEQSYSQEIVQQPESPTTQTQQNQVSAPLISAKLKQKFMEYQRQQQRQQVRCENNPHDAKMSLATHSNHLDSDRQHKYPESTRKADFISTFNNETFPSKQDNVAHGNSIRREIAALRELVETYREKYTKETLIPSPKDTRSNVDSWNIPNTQRDEERLDFPVTNQTCLSYTENEVGTPYSYKEIDPDKYDQKEPSSCAVELESKTFSRTHHSSMTENNEPSLLPDSFTKAISAIAKEDGSFSFRSFFNLHSACIQRLENALLAAYDGNFEPFLDLIAETSTQNHVELLLYCLDRLVPKDDSKSIQNVEHIQNLERKISQEQRTGEQKLQDMQVRIAAIGEEIEDCQAKLSRTELAFQVALTEKRHLEHRYPSLQLCGSIEEEIEKLESRQRQREKQLESRLVQKNKNIQRLQQIVSERNKEIGVIYSEITELLENMEQAQDTLSKVG